MTRSQTASRPPLALPPPRTAPRSGRSRARHARAALAMGALIQCAAPPAHCAAAGPNILVIIADDLGADSLSLYNDDPTARFPPTPTIDDLARRGVLFRNAYSYPTCSPTRATILTGRYGFRTGIGYALAGPQDGDLPETEITLLDVLDANAALDYAHASVGKWHLGSDPSSPNALGGWSHFSGCIQGAIPDYYRWPKTVDGETDPACTAYATSDNVDDALAWLAEHTGQPWVLWLGFNASHVPYHKPPDELHEYDHLPDNPLVIAASPPRPYFEAMTQAMDTEIARLLEEIDLDVTTVIFLGDNGTAGQVIQPPYAADRGKGTLYEGGIRVPFIIAGAGVTSPNRASDALVHTVDIFATILDLAGADPTAALPAQHPIDSRSLMPILRDETPGPAFVYGPILSENFSDSLAPELAGRAIRDERFKLIRFADGRDEYYDLTADALETDNLLDAPLDTEQATHLAALQLALDQLAEAPAAPDILAVSAEGARFTVTVATQPNVAFTLWQTSDLPASAWSPVPDAEVAPNGETLTLTDPAADVPARFYHVTAQ